MTQPHRGLDEPLVELLLWRGGLHPERLPRLVGLEEVAAVEEHNPGQVTRIILIGAHFHAYIVAGDWRSDVTSRKRHGHVLKASSAERADRPVPDPPPQPRRGSDHSTGHETAEPARAA